MGRFSRRFRRRHGRLVRGAGRSRARRALGVQRARWDTAKRLPRFRVRERRAKTVVSLVATPEEVPSHPRLRMQVVGVAVLILFAVMALRLWSLQVIDRGHYASAVLSEALRTVTVPAPRGLIVDRGDVVLAGNEVQNELVLSRAAAAADPGIVGKVAALAGTSPTTVEQALADLQVSQYEPVPVLDNATPAVVQYLDAHRSEFPGVSVEQVTVRTYPQGGTTATQVLGYAGPITAATLRAHPNAGYTQTSEVGKTGIEAQAERYLRGRAGSEKIEVTPTGTVVGGPPVHETKPVQGDTVVLNITGPLQRAVQAALATDINNDRATLTSGVHPAATNGAAVVMDATTGTVLALASYPSYNLNEWVGGISTANYDALKAGCTLATGGCPLNNYAIDGLYTPGSTFKLATATAGLRSGLITPYSTKDDTGVFDVRTHGYPACSSGCTFHDATAFDAGVITVGLALTESDDFFFYTLGLQFWLARSQFGRTAIQNVAHKYGFGTMTGIDLPGEVQGRVDSQRTRKLLHHATPSGFPNTSWYPATNIEMAFGQGETVVTPIEEAQAYATFADKGTRHRPEVIGAIVTPGGRVVRKVKPEVTGHVSLAAGDYAAMLRGFIGATHTPKGTAYSTFQTYSHVPSSYVIAGKTGTATTSSALVSRAPNAWFVGFGPVGRATQYVVVIAVAQGGYGATAAAPGVASIFNDLYAHPPRATLQLPTARRQPTLTQAGVSPASHTPGPGSTGVPSAGGHVRRGIMGGQDVGGGGSGG